MHAPNAVRIAASLAVTSAALLATAAAAEPAASPPALAARLAQCAGPGYRSANFDVEPGNGGFALQAVSERHWVDLAGRASFDLVGADSGEPVATVRIDLPPPGQFARQQGLREHALLDAAARTGARLRQVELPSGARLLTLNKREMTGKYAGISVLSDPGSGLFVQWQWMRRDAYGDARDLDAVQAAVWRNVLPCTGQAGAG
jgi:hypothetical protein